jgi:hypothetical protein
VFGVFAQVQTDEGKVPLDVLPAIEVGPPLAVLPPIAVIEGYLRSLSIERVQAELFKILMLPDPVPVLKAIDAYGAWVLLMGEAPQNVSALARLLNVLPLACAMTRLVALLGDVPLTDLPFKLSRAQAKKYEELRTSDRLYIGTHHPEWWVEANCLRHALHDAGLSPFDVTPLPEFPLKAADLLALGFEPGVALGDALRQVKQEWLINECTWDHAQCVVCAKQLYLRSSK